MLRTFSKTVLFEGLILHSILLCYFYTIIIFCYTFRIFPIVFHWFVLYKEMLHEKKQVAFKHFLHYKI